MSIIVDYPYTPEFILNTQKQVTHIIERPYLKVRLAYKHKISVTPVMCLVDSGADFNLFPASWGESVGIKIHKGTPRTVVGIGSYPVSVFRHNIKVYIVDSKISFETFVDFSEDITVPLLGREGFFNKFKSVSFLQEKSCLKLEF